MSAVLELTETTLDEVIAASPVPVVVEFGAEWCPPCQLIAPILAALAEEYSDRLRVVTIDTDQHPELARRFDVMSVPTILAFSEGELRHRMIGARSRDRLVEELSDLIS